MWSGSQGTSGWSKVLFLFLDEMLMDVHFTAISVHTILSIHSFIHLFVIHHTAQCSRILSHVPLSLTLWTVAHQAPLPMGFLRQEYWSGSPCPPRGGLPDPGMQRASPVSPAPVGGVFTPSYPTQLYHTNYIIKNI